MKMYSIIITTKNPVALKNFLTFFNKNSHKHFRYIKKLYYKKIKKKIITILKSPHVHKTAQEQFEVKLYLLQILVFTTHICKILIFIKKLKFFVLSNISLKIKILNNKKQQKQIIKKIFNVDNFTFKNYPKSLFCSNYLNSKNLLKLFDIYGNKIHYL